MKKPARTSARNLLSVHQEAQTDTLLVWEWAVSGRCLLNSSHSISSVSWNQRSQMTKGSQDWHRKNLLIYLYFFEKNRYSHPTYTALWLTNREGKLLPTLHELGLLAVLRDSLTLVSQSHLSDSASPTDAASPLHVPRSAYPNLFSQAPWGQLPECFLNIHCTITLSTYASLLQNLTLATELICDSFLTLLYAGLVPKPKAATTLQERL